MERPIILACGGLSPRANNCGQRTGMLSPHHKSVIFLSLNSEIRVVPPRCQRSDLGQF